MLKLHLPPNKPDDDDDVFWFNLWDMMEFLFLMALICGAIYGLSCLLR